MASINHAIELQVISKILTSENEEEVKALTQFDKSFYSVMGDQIQFILDYINKYNEAPDIFTFQSKFPDIQLVSVKSSITFLCDAIKENKKIIVFREMFNKVKDLGSEDISLVWEYIRNQCDYVLTLNDDDPVNVVADSVSRSEQLLEYSKQQRIPTGFKEIDNLLYGGLSTVEELCILVARTNTGKAQPLWSKVLTPTGWKTMGDIKVGDIVVGKNNDNGRVVQIFPQGVVDYYRVNFSDGTFAECCGNHLWEVRKNNSKNHIVVTTNDIIKEMSLEDEYNFFDVDLTSAIELENNSIETRKKYVSDLLETDFEHSKSWVVTSNASEELVETLRSLGAYAYIYNKTLHFNYFSTSKRIISIEYVGTTECQCIMLDNKSHTYITDNYTVTHNTWVCTKFMEAAQKNGFPVLYYSPEMQSAYLGARFDVLRGHFKNDLLIQGKYDDAYLDYIKKLHNETTGAYILEDKDVQGGEVNTHVIGNIVNKLGIKLVIIDGLSYMADTSKSTSTVEKYKNICASLFQMSKRYGCAVIVAVQANRETRSNADDKGEPFPNLYNIEGSDHPARIATTAFSMRRIFGSTGTDTLELRMEKSRNSKNNKAVLTYSWDINTGNIQYLPSSDMGEFVDDTTPIVQINSGNTVINNSKFDIDYEDDLDFTAEF